MYYQRNAPKFDGYMAYSTNGKQIGTVIETSSTDLIVEIKKFGFIKSETRFSIYSVVDCTNHTVTINQDFDVQFEKDETAMKVPQPYFIL